mgnify:FL=1
MSKFQRLFQLTFETRDGDKVVLTNPFTMQFNIVRHNLSSASNANIKIYNLGLANRERIFFNAITTPEKFLHVELRAGYEGMMPIIFSGDILDAQSYRGEGSPNFITEINAYDGGFDLAHADTNRGEAAGTLRVSAIRNLCKDLTQCKIGAIGNFPGSYARQRVFAGATKQLLEDETGGNFFIDNQRVYCLKDNEYVEGEVLVISSETGLLGSPTRCEMIVTAEMLFEPRLKIGQVVDLVSRDYPSLNQLYKVIGIQHSGTISDAVGGKCKTTVRMLYGIQNLTPVESES